MISTWLVAQMLENRMGIIVNSSYVNDTKLLPF